MTVAFPSAAGDVTVVASTATLTAAPPLNTADGDVLVAVASTRTGSVTAPSGWTSVVATFGTDGFAVVHVLPVPTASALPASWTWTAGSARSTLIIARATGVSLSSPVSQAGTPASAGTDAPGALPLVLPGVTAGGGVLGTVFTYFTETAPPSAYVPGLSLIATASTPAAGAGRSAIGLYAAAATGATGTVTCAATSTWASGAATGQSGVLVGLTAAAGSHAGAAALSGSGSLTAGAVVTVPAGAALSGSGALTSSPAVQFQAACALSGSGSVTAAAAVTQPASAALSGSGSVTAAAAVRFTAGAVLSGSGDLAAAGSVTQPAAASLAGSGSLTAAVSVQFSSASVLSGTGTLTASGTVAGLASGSAALSGSGALSAAASLVLGQAAVLSGSGTLAAAALVTVPGAAALSGSGLLLAAVSVTVPASAALSGSGTLTASAAAGGSASAALSGSGALAAGAVITIAASASLAGAGFITVSAQVTAPVTELPVAWSAAPAPPRWQCTPQVTRWKVVMAVFPPIAAVSLECVNVTWLSDLDGTSVDPTGQADGQPELPVQMAFPQTSGNYAEPAQPETWLTASWLLGGTGKGYTAQCLVGPGGGVVTLTAGQAYDVWGKVTGSPESPARFTGTLSVY